MVEERQRPSGAYLPSTGMGWGGEMRRLARSRLLPVLAEGHDGEVRLRRRRQLRGRLTAQGSRRGLPCTHAVAALIPLRQRFFLVPERISAKARRRLRGDSLMFTARFARPPRKPPARARLPRLRGLTPASSARSLHRSLRSAPPRKPRARRSTAAPTRPYARFVCALASSLAALGPPPEAPRPPLDCCAYQAAVSARGKASKRDVTNSRAGLRSVSVEKITPTS